MFLSDSKGGIILDTKTKKGLFFIAILVLSILWVAIQWAVLPPQVAMQLGANGTRQNFMPKAFAVAVPFLLSVGGAGFYLKDSQNKSYALLSLLGLAAPLMTLLMN